MAGETKKRILETALEMFAQSGYLGTSMSDIANKLGITKGALYKHYTSKQEILCSILQRADIGISDFEVIKDKIATVETQNDILNINTQMQINPTLMTGQIKTENENVYHIDVKTDFDVFDKNNEVVGKKPVMLFKENGFNSEGTMRLFCYLGWILWNV